MKILHVIFSMNTGGAEILLVDILNEQVKTENVHLIIINDTFNKNLVVNINKNIKIHYVNRVAQSLNPIKILKLNYLVLKINADIIHCHNHNIAALLAFKLNKPLCLTIHCLSVPIKYLTRYTNLFSISNAVKQDILSRKGPSSIVIYNGIDFSKIKQKSSFEFVQKPFKIIHLSRLDYEIKGQDVLIKAIHYLINTLKVTDVIIDFVGEGPEAKLDHLINLTASFKLNEVINFTGLKERSYVQQNLRSYDLLIQPSISEGFGLAIVEGIAAKVPVLVSDLDGPLEVIQFGDLGYSFKTADYIDCAEKIKTIYLERNNEKFTENIDRVYEKASVLYEIKTTSENYLLRYRYIMNKTE